MAVSGSNDGKFFTVAESIGSYASELEKVCTQYSEKGTANHFSGTMRAVESLWNGYEFEEIIRYISAMEQSQILKSWFGTIVCMIVCGFSAESEISAEVIPFSEKNYLRVWKNSFITQDGDDNSIDSLQNSSEGLCVYRIKYDGKSSLLGCCSKRYFVIPPCEVTDDGTEWKKMYLSFMKKGT